MDDDCVTAKLTGPVCSEYLERNSDAEDDDDDDVDADRPFLNGPLLYLIINLKRLM